MKILTASQIRELDKVTIATEPIRSIDLMERASRVLADWFMENFSPRHKVYLFCGPGNNGGDGLAVARMLAQNKYQVTPCLVLSGDRVSEDTMINLERLEKSTEVRRIAKVEDIPDIAPGSYIIDALFGYGLNRPLEGLFKEVVIRINQSDAAVVSIDVPSGVIPDSLDIPLAVKADFTMTFQVPKLSFFTPEGGDYIGRLIVLDIRLDKDFLAQAQSPYHYVEARDIRRLIKPRRKFSHKGDFGKVLLAGGSSGKGGAIALSARACLRSGAGLVTVNIPGGVELAVNQHLVEAMTIADSNHKWLTTPPDIRDFDVLGIGPGMGQNSDTISYFKLMLDKTKSPVVVDADAINILAGNRDMLSMLPPQSILTPHPGEFRRLVGDFDDGFDALKMARAFCEEYAVIIVLKTANTAIIVPDGNIYFNSTGNPGMATAGSGDVLTGIITSFLGQKLSPADAALAGVYIHGLAGDFAAKEKSYHGLIASDIIENLPKAFQAIS